MDAEKGVETAEDALSGASDIVAETISDDAETRKVLRSLLEREGRLCSQAAVEEDSVYRLYYDFSSPSGGSRAIRSWPSTGGRRRAF